MGKIRLILCWILIGLCTMSTFATAQKYTLDQCIQIAKAEIAKQLPDYADKIIFYKDYSRGYLTEHNLYFYKAVNGIPNMDELVRVVVDFETGEVTLFQVPFGFGNYSENKVDTTPKVSKEISICTAQNVYSDVNPNQEPELQLMGKDNPILVWAVKWYNTWIKIDAHTGVAVSIPLTEGGPPSGEGVCPPHKIALITAKQYIPYILPIVLIGLVGGVYLKKNKLLSLIRK